MRQVKQTHLWTFPFPLILSQFMWTVHTLIYISRNEFTNDFSNMRPVNSYNRSTIGINYNTKYRMGFTFLLLNIPFHQRKTKYILLYKPQTSLRKNDVRIKVSLSSLYITSWFNHQSWLFSYLYWCRKTKNKTNRNLKIKTR